MQPVRSADPGADGPLTAWYRALAAGERLTLALSLSLALHAAGLLLPGPAPRAARVPGVLSVRLPPSSLSGSPLPGNLSSLPDTPPAPLPNASALPAPRRRAMSDELPGAPPAMTVEASAPGTMLPAPALPGMEGDGYFPAAALDVLAEPLQPVTLALPPDAPAGEVRLMLRVYINEQGGVDAVEPEQPDPSGVLGREARRVFREVRFVPARRHGLAVKSYKRIEVRMQN